MTITPELLRSFTPLDSLSDDSIASFCDSLVLRSMPAGRSIFTLGENDDALYFLVSGEVVLISEDDKQETVQAGSKRAKLSLCSENPRNRSAIALCDATYLRVDNAQLDIHITWQQSASYVVTELSEAGETDDQDWMTQILSSHIFFRIPPANISKFFSVVEHINAKPGDEVITQGELGDFYYMIKQGSAEILRYTNPTSQPIKLATITAGDAFGEEALVSSAPRNATVRMTSEASLIRLSKNHFDELLKAPTIEEVSLDELNAIPSDQKVLIDVRLQQEHDNVHLENSVHIPLFMLRLKLNSLDESKHYYCYCDTGSRSAAAAYLLNQAGFTASVLKSGLNHYPNSI